jgi:phosphoribosylformylglycinamidine synthase
MKVGVVVFPGSNCDHDTYHVVKHVMGQEARFVWHKDASLGDLDAVVLPGGFAYGDYLRTGAVARFSPIMRAVTEFAAKGGPVLGICNGFQILQEAGLLPGAMLSNKTGRFLSQPVHVCNERRNVVGLMPHPERAAEPELGSADGRRLFEALIGVLQRA